MQKILRKRVWRDLKANIVRYLALALLIFLAMYMVVSLLGAAETIIRGTKKTDEEHGVEDGEFSLFVPMTDEEWTKLTEQGVTLEKQFFLDYLTEDDRTIRVFQNRESINTVEIVEGTLASAENEIVIERRYAEENEIKVGDTITFGGKDFAVCGIGVTPDYNSTLKNLGDSTIDSKNFGTAFVTAETYDALLAEGKSAKSEEYYYAYHLNDSMTDDELKNELKELEFTSDDVQDAFFQEYWDRTVGQKDDLTDGIDDLFEGTNELADGLKELADNNKSLTNGADAVLDAYLEEANDALSAYGVEKLTKDNFETVLNAEISDAENAMVRATYRELLSQLQELAEYADGVRKYTDGVADAQDGAEEIADGVQDLKEETDEKLDDLFTYDAGNLMSFIKADDNVRIQAASGDQELYLSIGMIAGAILLILISYVLSVFVVHTIDQESAVIGALYALGVTRKNLMAHYVMLPSLVTGIAGVIGTLLGYSRFGAPVQMADAYNYYSLPDLDVVYMPYLFIYGIIVPPVAAVIVNSLVIRKRLSKPVLALIKNEQKVSKGKNVNLKDMSFMHLFKVRQMLREARTGFTVVFGMFVSILLVVMALEIYIYCRNVGIDYVADTKYEYMYTYKYPTEDVPEGAYKAYAKTLKKSIYGYSFDVTVLGVTDDNPFFDVECADMASEVTISSSILYKYGLDVGDVITLNDEENDKIYAFDVTAVTQYSPTFMVFMDYDRALELFGEPDDYFNVVFSDHALDIESGRLYSTSTKADVEKGADIFIDQMQSMIITIGAVSILIFVVVLYLMMKVMIDRSSFHISLIKIFGYRDKEVKKMYLDGNFYIVTIGALISIPLSKLIMDAIYEPAFCPNVACGINKAFPWWIYGSMFVVILALYFVINHLLIRRIRKMVPAEVLKNRE